MKFRLLFITLFICSVAMAQNTSTASVTIQDKDSISGVIPVISTEAKDTIVSDGEHLENVVVKSVKSREKESVLLLDQQQAVEIKQSIGAQELSRKGVSDVATAVTKTTGITKQEGSGNIFVRGLGDRYNSTTMNGLPIPSNDPEKKNLNLEIFSTDILEYVGIDKVYNSRLYGDFAGGNVDIVSKDYKGNGFMKLEVGSKINTNAMNEDDFSLQKRPSSSGFTNISIPSNGLTQYNFNTLQLDTKDPIGTSLGISGGESFQVGSEGKLSLFATAAFGNEYTSKSDGTAKSNVNGSGVANKNFEKYTSFNYNTNSTAMANVGYKIKANKINFNSVFINTSSQSKEEFTGYIADIADDGNGLIRRSTYEKNSLWVNQLLGDHKLNDRSKLNWGISYNTIKGDLPDRTQNTFRKETNGYILSSISAPNNHRYFQSLKENEIAANTSFDYKFNKKDEGEFQGKITFGYSGKIKARDFEATQFNFKSSFGYTNTVVDPDNLDLFYNQENFSNGYFTIATFRGNSQVTNALDPQTFNGDQTIHAAFVTTEYKSDKLTTILGLRGESIYQKVKWNTQLDPAGGEDELKKFAFLPSLIMKYELTEKQNLRFGFSKTYTLPQFKERALFVYEEVLQVKVGNPYLYESDNYNLDIKWEMFPKSEELISLTAFGKYIQNPMNEVTISSSSNDVSFINTGDFGYVAGAEIEYRKILFQSDEAKAKKLSTGINASYLYSDQSLDAEKVKEETDYQVAFTNEKSRFTGASDLLLNADLTFFNEWNNKQSNLTTTLAYSYFSDRVNAIGTDGKGNLVDKAFGSLDFITKSKLTKNLGLGLVVKNILDPVIERVQENSSGDVNVLSYKKGLTLSLNINYQF
ncbi:TonB-dependent receptor domain-containing protein [Flavobacterium sp. GT3R68]|uniref:TonB-dependent receptor domain-containing protein n=1 Tax=Flavobacterium sp. GT3R68 TaxID=2594437 RepID=UPI000F86B1F8|nr:TonB-dependent receptor [Flavobacterium sp. GT3R68]RTY91346.1 TonB-dependent receptor [Flavobacterium sp. GSN2]TRW93972.1 outer membrane beta-barrel protein [Flavobacterium sp. GT3R68]